MKRKFTEAKAANRASNYAKFANPGAMSAKREDKRDYLHRAIPKTFREPVRYIQRILYRRDQFGNPCFKMIPHAFETA